MRGLISQFSWHTDSCYRVDCYEDDPYIDFHQRIITPEQWSPHSFEEVIEESK